MNIVPYERNTLFINRSTEELERRETERVSANAFIQDVDRKLLEITETPPTNVSSDELFGLYVSVARERHLQGLCYLVEELNDSSSSLGRIDIDNPEHLAAVPVGSAIGIYDDERTEANNIGKQEAARDLMYILAPSENDLLRTLSSIGPFSQNILDMYANPWKRDLLQMADLEQLGEFTDGIKYYQGGIVILTLETRLPTINYSLVYGPGSQIPSRYLYAVDKV